MNASEMIYDSVPHAWFKLGKCVRHTVSRELDGSLKPCQSWEYFLTLHLPWSHNAWDFDKDEIVRTHRFILRFKPAWAA